MSNRAILLCCVVAAFVAGGIVASGMPAWAVAAIFAFLAAEGALRVRRAMRDAVLDTERRLLGSIRWREEQLANTAHELRTPLSAVATALEMLREGVASTPSEQAMFVEQASAASRHMAFLIHDVVDLAAIESGRLRLQMREHRIEDLLADVAKVMALPAQSRDVALDIATAPAGVAVAADRGRFLQVAFNLVANALKFSTAGSKVRIAVECGRSSARFEVHDEGPGVDDAKRGALFTRFSSNAETGEGSGLGLYVSSMLVACMGGAIGHHPGKERGSVFWFSLPLAERRRQHAAVDDIASAPSMLEAPPQADRQSVAPAEHASA
jgi:signal transduction histidine kinase